MTLHGDHPPAQTPIHVGCAGWSLSAKVAAWFPGPGTHLERYARVFSSVEINSSFYRPHQPKTYARWAASVPEAFRFSVKMPRRISHELRLRGADAAVRDFLAQIAPLGAKLGCLLLQLPPSLAFDKATVSHVFSLLRSLTQTRIACEPRHATWFTDVAAATMAQYGIACVHADPPPVAGIEPVGDSRTLYLRLHGSPEIYASAYDEAFIEAVAARMIEARHVGVDTWCIFDNTARGEAIPNARMLMETLGLAFDLAG